MTITDSTHVRIAGDTMFLEPVEVFHGAAECRSCLQLVFVPAEVGDSDELVEQHILSHERTCAEQVALAG